MKYKETGLVQEIGPYNQFSGWRNLRTTGGISDKHHGGEDEENIKMSNIAIVVCEPTELTGMMTPGPELDGGVTSPGLDIGQARRKATICARVREI